MKKISLIILGLVLGYFIIAISFSIIKGDEKLLTKEEAIELNDFVYEIVPDNKEFSTQNKTFKLGEEAIIYKNDKPLIGWTFKLVATERDKQLTHQDYIGDEDGRFRIELEVENFNYTKEPYTPEFSIYSSVYTTDRGVPLSRSQPEDFTPIGVGEKATFTNFYYPERMTKKREKIYVRYYYVEELLGLPIGTRSNYIDFELDIT